MMIPACYHCNHHISFIQKSILQKRFEIDLKTIQVLFLMKALCLFCPSTVKLKPQTLATLRTPSLPLLLQCQSQIWIKEKGNGNHLCFETVLLSCNLLIGNSDKSL